MHKLGEFDVSFDPTHITGKERGIKFWYDHIKELEILQNKKALDLKNPYSGIQTFMTQKKIINMAEKQSEWDFLPHKDINREDSKQLLNTIRSIRNTEETKNALKKVYFDQENFEIFKPILITQFTTNNSNDLFEIVRCGATSATQDLKLEELQAKKTEIDKEMSKAKPDYVPIEVKDNKQYKLKDDKTKELEAIRDFEGAGDLKMTTETCVRDWLIDGGYDHEFKRCKPQGAVEYNEKDKYGWNTNGEEFVSRYRQNTVFGVPVLFDQNMVFDQAKSKNSKSSSNTKSSAPTVSSDEKIKKCFLKICSEILRVFKHEKTWYYKIDPAKQFLKYTIKGDDMTFFYGENDIELKQ